MIELNTTIEDFKRGNGGLGWKTLKSGVTGGQMGVVVTVIRKDTGGEISLQTALPL